MHPLWVYVGLHRTSELMVFAGGSGHCFGDSRCTRKERTQTSLAGGTARTPAAVGLRKHCACERTGVRRKCRCFARNNHPFRLLIRDD